MSVFLYFLYSSGSLASEITENRSVAEVMTARFCGFAEQMPNGQDKENSPSESERAMLYCVDLMTSPVRPRHGKSSLSHDMEPT